MADDESWLYGDESTAEGEGGTPDVKPIIPKEETGTPEVETGTPPTAEETAPAAVENLEESNPEEENGIKMEEGEVAQGEEEEVAPEDDPDMDEDEEDDSDDDGFRITIDQNKIEEAKSSYNNGGVGSNVPGGGTPFGLKASRTPHAEKKGKFSVEEMDQIGNINGVPAHELDIESLEEKPWKKPGADITDYFNYGFTEDTWQAYCNRQRKMRVGESGVGMPGVNNNSIVTTKTHPLGVVPGTPLLLPSSSTTNNASYSSSATAPTQSIPTLGGPPKAPSPASGPLPPSSIAVMTHDKREYSKKVISEIDFSVPPPGIPTVGSGPPNISLPPPPIPPATAPPSEDPFEFPSSYTGYEPTMEAQWTAPPGDRDYDDRDWHNRRSSRERRDYDRKRRRSRSRSRDRYRRRRSRSKSPSYKHKKSKKEKRERKQEESSSSSSKQKESEDRND